MVKELNKTLWNVVVNKEINYKLLQLSSKALRFRWLMLNMHGAGITFFNCGTEHLGDHKVVTSFDTFLFSIASFTVGIFLQKHLTSLAFSRSLVYWDFWPFIIHFKSAFKIHAGTALTADFAVLSPPWVHLFSNWAHMDKLQWVSGDLSFAFFNIYICVLRLIQFIMILRAFFSLVWHARVIFTDRDI